MLKDADTFSTGDYLVVNFEDQKIRFGIKSKTRWWIEAYCLNDNTNYRICRYK